MKSVRLRWAAAVVALALLQSTVRAQQAACPACPQPTAATCPQTCLVCVREPKPTTCVLYSCKTEPYCLVNCRLCPCRQGSCGKEENPCELRERHRLVVRRVPGCPTTQCVPRPAPVCAAPMCPAPVCPPSCPQVSQPAAPPAAALPAPPVGTPPGIAQPPAAGLQMPPAPQTLPAPQSAAVPAPALTAPPVGTPPGIARPADAVLQVTPAPQTLPPIVLPAPEITAPPGIDRPATLPALSDKQPAWHR
jgi:hypothetical protein